MLAKELAAPDYEPRMIAIGTNTDPYQPIERERKIMRGILEVLERAGHPVGIVTKSALVARDIDILSRMAKRNLAKVAISITSLDPKLARTMEPRAPTPPRRLEALKALSEAGIPTTVMVAPVIPALNDSEIERILDAAAHAGVKEASYVLLRLPLEVRDLFREWLMANYPDRYRHVFTLIRDMRGGRDYNSQWGTRMKGTGPMAWMIGRRFEIACEKLGLNKRRSKLTTDHFVRPKGGGQQLSLFYDSTSSWPGLYRPSTSIRVARRRGLPRRQRVRGMTSRKTSGDTMSKSHHQFRASPSSPSASADMRASIAFYEALGFARKFRATGEAVAFFDTGAHRDRAVPLGSARAGRAACRTSRGRRHFAASRSPGTAARRRRSMRCWISRSRRARNS